MRFLGFYGTQDQTPSLISLHIFDLRRIDLPTIDTYLKIIEAV